MNSPFILDLSTTLHYSTPRSVAPKSSLPRRYLLSHEEGDPLNVFTLSIDNTSLEYFTSCSRSAFYRLFMARGVEGSSATFYGSGIHIYLEKRLAGASVDEACEALKKHFALNPYPLRENDFRTLEHALSAMERYERHWIHRPLDMFQKDGKNVVEFSFSLPLTTIPINEHLPYRLPSLISPSDFTHFGEEFLETDPYVDHIKVRWTGRIDGLVRSHLGLSVLDHKTSSIAGAQYFKEFELSQQIIGYVWAARQLFPSEQISSALLNLIIGRPITKTGTAHAFERHHYVYPPHRLEEWHRNTCTLVADFVSHLLRGYFPMETRWCINKFGTCPYHDVCLSPPESRPLLLSSSQYTDITWSPLNER